MQSPCTKEVTKLRFHGCFPTSLSTLNEPAKPASGKLVTSSADNRRTFATTTSSSLFPNTDFSNPESLPPLQEAYYQFIKTYPQFLETRRIDDIRDQEYYHLSLSNHVCLDYIGIGLFSFSQLHRQLSLSQMTASTSSSPLPTPPCSSDFPVFHLSYKSVNLKTHLIEERGNESKLESTIKHRIGAFLNISEEDYSVILTSNRTSAFKMIAESYPFGSYKKLLTVYDHESDSIEEIIGSSDKRGAQTMSAEFTWPRLRIHSTKLRNMIISKGTKTKKRGLIVFQLQSRVTGARYSYQWIKVAQENGWHVLLDACAVGPKDMDSLGLSLYKPDFIVCSFYKVFGENPSGFGCLIVNKSAVSILESSTSAGIVSIVTPKRPFYLPDESSSYETEIELEHNELDSSSDSLYHNGEKINHVSQMKNTRIRRKTDSSVECRGLDHVDSLRLSVVNSRGRYLVNWLIHALKKLRHPNSENGVQLVRIYGPKIKFDRGPALAFNVFDWKGEKVEPILVQKLADRKNISLSYVFLQHIWFPETYEAEKIQVLEKRRCDEGNENSGNKRKEKETQGIRVITAAFGFIANFADVYTLWDFVAQFLNVDFIEKERLRYSSLNQQIVEI